MEVLILILLLVLEAALLLAGLAVLQFRSLRRLRAELEALQQDLDSRNSAEEGFESIESGFLPYLEKQLIDTREMQEITAQSAEPDASLVYALQRRATFLEAEKHVAELGNDFPKHHWEHVTEHYGPQEEAAAEAVPEVPESTDTDQPESLQQMQGALQQQGVALESVRTLFEQVKEDPSAEALEQMEQQLQELERRYQEANTCIEMMEQENARLQQAMEGVEEEKRQNAQALEAQIGKQKENVSELCEMLDDLELEAEKAQQLQKKIDAFELTSRDMNLCIQVLEEENEELHKQVNYLQQQQGGDEAGSEEAAQQLASLEQEVGALKSQLGLLETEKNALGLQWQEQQETLAEKEQALAQLEERYASLEKEYLTLYEASQE